MPVDGTLMTYSEAVSCFGDSIPIRYLDRSGVYHDETANLVTNNVPFTIGQTNYIDDTSYLVATRQVVLYSFQTEYSTPVNQTPQQVTVKLQPEYSIFDTSFIYTAIGIQISLDTNLSAYNSPVWNWVFAGQNVQFDAVNTASNDVLPNYYLKNANGYFLGSNGGNFKFNFVPAYMTSQALTSGYSTEATFDNVWGDSSGGRQTIYIAIGVPYVSAGASGATGTPASTSDTTSQNINVNVDIDMSETNGILGTISSSISNLASSIISGITGIFIPSQEDFQRFRSTIDTKLEENFGVAYTAHTIIHDTIAGVDTTQIEETIDIPQINIPVVVNSSGEVLQTMPFGGWTVSLKPESTKLSFLYSSLRLIGNIIVTLAVINTLRNKFEYFINGGVTVVMKDE